MYRCRLTECVKDVPSDGGESQTWRGSVFLRRRLLIGVEGNGIVARKISVRRGREVIGDGVIGWN